MASLVVFFFSLVIIFMAASFEAAARQFKVGDDFGWQQPNLDNPSFYTHWAQTNRFQIGDSLAFEYQNDSVLTVEKWDYFHCDATDPITAFDNGKSMINLDRPGLFYFISGTHDHCINGQRLIVDVMSPHPINPVPAISPPPVSPAPPPEPYLQPSPQPQVGPSSPSSSSPTTTTTSASSSEVSYPLVLKSDFMALLVVSAVILLCY